MRMKSDRRGRAVLKRDVDQAAVVCQRADVLVDVVTADNVEDDVDAFARCFALDRLGEILRFVVDGDVGAERGGAGRAFLVRSDGREYGCAERLRELDGGHADAAGAAVDEEFLTGFEMSAFEDVVPDGEERLRDRRCFDEGDRVRLLDAAKLRYGNVFGIAAARNQSHHRIANGAACHAPHPGPRWCPRLRDPEARSALSAADNGPAAAARRGGLTPAAATLISTSPGFASGSGRSVNFRTSGPPAPSIAMAFIEEGRLIMFAFLAPRWRETCTAVEIGASGRRSGTTAHPISTDRGVSNRVGLS